MDEAGLGWRVSRFRYGFDFVFQALFLSTPLLKS